MVTNDMSEIHNYFDLHNIKFNIVASSSNRGVNMLIMKYKSILSKHWISSKIIDFDNIIINVYNKHQELSEERFKIWINML